MKSEKELEMEIALSEVLKGHFSNRKAVPKTERNTVTAIWKREEKYLMNSITFIGLQKNVSYRCVCL